MPFQRRRETLTEHLETDAVVVPNGIYAKRLAQGVIHPEWSGNSIGFIGRYKEPRKGLAVLIEALPAIIESIPDVKVVVAGPGDSDTFLQEIPDGLRSRFIFLGRVTEQEKSDLLKSVAVYVAPNTGGESFGIILAEALAGGAAVIASDIPAFASLLGQGKYGKLFKSEDPQSLAKVTISLLNNPAERAKMRSVGQSYAMTFDWSEVAERIYDVYEMAMNGLGKVALSSDSRSWSKFIGKSS